MKLAVTTAAALIGLATAFGPAGTASAASLPDGTPVIEVGGRHFGGHRSGHRSGHRGGGRDFGRRGHGRGHHRGNGFGHHRSHGHGHGRGHYDPYFYGGAALGTFLFLNALEGH